MIDFDFDPIDKSHKLNKKERDLMFSYINNTIFDKKNIYDEIKIIKNIDEEMLLHYNDIISEHIIEELKNFKNIIDSLIVKGTVRCNNTRSFSISFIGLSEYKKCFLNFIKNLTQYKKNYNDDNDFNNNFDTYIKQNKTLSIKTLNNILTNNDKNNTDDDKNNADDDNILKITKLQNITDKLLSIKNNNVIKNPENNLKKEIKHEFIKYREDIEIISKINKFTLGLLNGFSWNNNIIFTGGLLYDILIDRYDISFCDIDIFITGNDLKKKIEICKNIFNYLIENQYDIYIDVNKLIIGIYIKNYPRKIQLILVNESPEEIILSFDFTHLMFYFDGKTIYGTNISIKQLENGKQTIINKNYHHYRIIKYYKRNVDIDIWNDEYKYFVLNLVNRGKLLKEYFEKKHYEDALFFSKYKCHVNNSDYKFCFDLNSTFCKIEQDKINYKNSIDDDIIENMNKNLLEYNKNIKSFIECYILDFSYVDSNDLIKQYDDFEYLKIYSFIGKSLYLKCKFFKNIINLKNNVMINYIIIEEVNVIDYILKKIDKILEIFKEFKGDILLPYKFCKKNKMLLCSRYYYTTYFLKDHIVSSPDVSDKLNDMKIFEEFDCVFDFNITNFCTYLDINLTPVLIF